MNRLISFALNEYPDKRDNLRGCINDQTNLVKKLDYLGFTFEKRLFQNNQCTLDNVMFQLERIIDDSVPGDVLVIHHSHHGTQVVDVNGDESDGYDEALCLYDDNLIDDDYNYLLSKLKEGVMCFIILDTCFSGTATRGSTSYKVERFLPETPGKDVKINVGKQILRGNNTKWIVLSACGENETSNDAYINNMWQGAGTYYFLQTLEKGITFNHWYKNIRKKLPNGKYKQTPELDGDKRLFDLQVMSPLDRAIREEKKSWWKKTWDYLDGKKRNIGIILALLAEGLKIFNIITPEIYNFTDGIIDVFLLGAITHTVVKSRGGRKFLRNFKRYLYENSIEQAVNSVTIWTPPIHLYLKKFYLFINKLFKRRKNHG